MKFESKSEGDNVIRFSKKASLERWQEELRVLIDRRNEITEGLRDRTLTPADGDILEGIDKKIRELDEKMGRIDKPGNKGGEENSIANSDNDPDEGKGFKDLQNRLRGDK